MSDDFLWPPETVENLEAADAAERLQRNTDTIFQQLRRLQTATGPGGGGGGVGPPGPPGPQGPPGNTSAVAFAQVYRATNRALTDGVEYVVEWDTEVSDVQGFWAIGAPTKFIVPVGWSGKYIINAQANIAYGLNTRLVACAVRKNGTVVAARDDAHFSQFAGVTYIGHLAEGDELDVSVRVDNDNVDLLGGAVKTFLQLVGVIGGASAGGGGGGGTLTPPVNAADIADGSVSNTEFQFLDGATSNLQAQIANIEARIDKVRWTRRIGYTNFFGAGTQVANAGIVGWVFDGGAFDYADVNAVYHGRNQPTTGLTGGMWTPEFLVQARHNPLLYIVFKLGPAGAILARRIFVGFTSTTSPQTTVDANTVALHVAGIRFSTSAPDATWQAMVCNGTAANTQLADTGVTPTGTGNEQIRLRIWTTDKGVTWWFSVNESAPVSLAVNVPTVSTYLRPVIASRNLGGGGVDQLVGVSRVYLESD